MESTRSVLSSNFLWHEFEVSIPVESQISQDHDTASVVSEIKIDFSLTISSKRTLGLEGILATIPLLLWMRRQRLRKER